MVGYILFILFILYKLFEKYDNQQKKDKKKKDILHLLEDEPKTKHKYLVDYQKELDVYKFVPGDECKHIGSWSDGTKTYFHKPNIFSCNCGYILDVELVSNMI